MAFLEYVAQFFNPIIALIVSTVQMIIYGVRFILSGLNAAITWLNSLPLFFQWMPAACLGLVLLFVGFTIVSTILSKVGRR